jgi:hypothetical protein
MKTEGGRHMKTQLMTATAAAFFLGLGSAAVGQDAGTTPGTALSAMGPSHVTCSELTAMGSDRAEGFLYFIAGYHQAERFGTTTTGMTGDGSALDTDAAAIDTAPAATDTAAADSATIDSDLPEDTGVDTAATDLPEDTGVDTAATDLPEDVGTDTAASVLPGDAAADVTGATGTVGADFDQYSGMGFVDIPVEQIMSACESEPQARVADLLQRELGEAGTTAQ